MRLIYLARALDPLHHDEEDYDPRKEEAQHDPPSRSARVLNGDSCVESGAVPEVRRSRGFVTLGDGGAVYHDAVLPR